MNDKCVEIHLHQFRENRNIFLIELYMYLLKSKNCTYIVLNFSKSAFEVLDKSIFDKVLTSYVYRKINNYSDIIFYDKDEAENMELINVEVNEVMIESVIQFFSYESLKIIQELGWDKMMLFQKSHFDDSIVVGAYDYQKYIVISNVNNKDVVQIKNLATKYFSEYNTKEIIKYI